MKKFKLLLFVVCCYFLFGCNVFASRNHCYVGLSPNSNNSVRPGDIVEFEVGMDLITVYDAGVSFNFRFFYDNNVLELLSSDKKSVIVNDEWVVDDVSIIDSTYIPLVIVKLSAVDPYKILTSNIFAKIRFKVKENVTAQATDLSFFQDSSFVFNKIYENNEIDFVDSDKCDGVQSSRIYILPKQPASTDSSIKQIIISSNEQSYYFDGQKNAYELSLDNSIESINISAECNSNGCKVNGTGEKKLNIGENKFVIESVSEAGTKSSYTINVIRKEKTVESANLSFLMVQDHNLNTKFDPNVYEYSIKVKKGTEELNVIANCASKKCEIKGNDIVQINSNTKIIEITTKTSDEEKKYSISIDYVDEEPSSENKIVEFFQNNLISIVIALSSVVVILTMIVIFGKKKQ